MFTLEQMICSQQGRLLSVLQYSKNGSTVRI